MAKWNKYEATSARAHGRPGAGDEAEEPDPRHPLPRRRAAGGGARGAASRPLDGAAGAFANAETKAAQPKQEADIRRAIASLDQRLADLDAMGLDMQVIKPPPPQCYYTVPLDIAVEAARIVNDGIAEFVARKPDRFVALRHRADAGRQGGRQGARALHGQARLQGRADPHQRRRQGALRPRLRAVLGEGRGARRPRRHPPNGFTARRAPVALLLQQRHRQPARDDDRAALPDLRRRARAAPQPQDPRRARRRLSRRLCGPHRPCLGGALGLPRRSAEPADELPEEGLFRHGGVHAAAAAASWSTPSAPTISSWAPTIPSTWPTYDPVGHVMSAGFDDETAAKIVGGNAKRLLGL